VGRSIVFKERGEILLLKFAQALEDLAKVEQLPKLEGKRMFLYLAPKAAAVAKPSKPAPQDAKVEKKAAKPVDAKEKNSVEEPAATNAAADTE
jgi:translation initiation factor IF-3